MHLSAHERRDRLEQRFGARSAPKVSFEFFPPKSEKAHASLSRSIDRLKDLGPQFVSVTYGADGSTRERTHDVIRQIKDTTSLSAMPHLTCVGADQSEIDDIADEYWRMGVTRIMALRGDPVDGAGARYVPHPGGYAYAADLVEGLRKRHDFDICVAAIRKPTRGAQHPLRSGQSQT